MEKKKAGKKRGAKRKPKIPKPDVAANRAVGSEVTEHFLVACRTLVSRRDRVRNFSKLAEELGTYKSIFTKLNNPDYKANIPLAMCARLCQKYKISGDWLLSGRGDMWGQEEATEKLETIEKALAMMDKQLGKVIEKK